MSGMMMGRGGEERDMAMFVNTAGGRASSLEVQNHKRVCARGFGNAEKRPAVRAVHRDRAQFGSSTRRVACHQNRSLDMLGEGVKTAVLLSGGGRSLENLIVRIEQKTLTNVEIACVIASKPSAGGIERARARSIPTHVIRPRDFEGEDTVQRFSAAINDVLDRHAVELVVLAGWMHFYLIPTRFEHRVINIHPSLLPSFCGKGYYGEKVHKAVLDFGAKVTGCTVHFADNQYDHGAIIVQRPVMVEDDDTVDTLAARVFEEEKNALAQAVQLYVDKKLVLEGRRVKFAQEAAL
ncbi:Trifunctional purine biosynthetic protein adenosine-3 [Porphyridium purpureum]|uniref:phosphoribosylglycinamide formyltransferase 1 n=1 Tax=Porphyridium purpureum TaxID=35688 RepID=A0A5J4YVS8_PORPP|nr:Trifunctional purine biosynthetic protein adenosine-3 [Porphyridium purpureum]|eukprot:POR9073..scf227_4